MRVIAGSARRLLLKTVEGMDTRPTTDRIKETLFNMIHNDLYDSTFLDLFAGSGAIGIEALSRGAKEAVFVDSGSRQIACIRDNLKSTMLDDRARVMDSDVFSALKKLEQTGCSFDFIFMDPPYDQGLEKRVLHEIKDSCLIHEDTVIIVEASLKTDFSWLDDMGYEGIRTKLYKTNQHVFAAKKKNPLTVSINWR